MDEAFEQKCALAAKYIRDADIFLLSIGAGFSADSGLAVYKDIADIPVYNQLDMTYSDLCDPCWLQDDPEVFYGFWGKCFNDYRNTTPHFGYNIIKKWRDKFFSYDETKPDTSFQYQFHQAFKKGWKDMVNGRYFGDTPSKYEEVSTGPFFIYSSNVDNHPITAGFRPEELVEIHGSIEVWQCSDNCSKDKSVLFDKVGHGNMWKAPTDFQFNVDEDTMRVIDDDMEGEWRQHPRCMHCDALARPNILMFGDWKWEDDGISDCRYSVWDNLATKKFLREGKKIVILEIGCGNNVPTVRFHDECK